MCAKQHSRAFLFRALELCELFEHWTSKAMGSDIDVGSDGEAAIAPPPITTPVKAKATRARTPNKTKCYLCEGSGKPMHRQRKAL